MSTSFKTANLFREGEKLLIILLFFLAKGSRFSFLLSLCHLRVGVPTEGDFREAIWQLLEVRSEASQFLLGRWPRLQLTSSGVAKNCPMWLQAIRPGTRSHLEALVRAERVAEHAPKHRPWLKAPSIGWVSSLATLKEAIEKLKSEYSWKRQEKMKTNLLLLP